MSISWFSFLEASEQVSIRKSLTSFLRWVYDHNPDFHQNLATEELTNCWLQEFEPPSWVHPKLRKDLSFVAHVNEFIEHHKHLAHNYPIEVTPKRKPKPKSLTSKPAAHDLITPKQLKFLLILTKKANYPQNNLQNLTKKEASRLIDDLLTKTS